MLLSGAALGLNRSVLSMLLLRPRRRRERAVVRPKAARAGTPPRSATAPRGADRSPLRTIATMTLGILLIYSVIVPWLMAMTHFGLDNALNLGVRPFLAGDALKVLLAAGLLPGTWRLVRRQDSRCPATASRTAWMRASPALSTSSAVVGRPRLIRSVARASAF